MKLLTKFNLVLIVFLGLGGFLIGQLAYSFLMKNARDQVLQEAELMMASARATRDYTSQEIKPNLLKIPDHTVNFLPQTVPAYSANTIFNHIRKQYPNYSYREATLNPTNLQDRADDWETDVIRYFADHPDQKSVSGERDTPVGRQLYLARPIPVGAPCLECHSTPDVAPVAMIKKYGSANGFGWKENQIITAQIVSVPMDLPISLAKKDFNHLLLYLVLTFIVTIVALDTAVYVLVIRPLREVATTANRVSKGETDAPGVRIAGKDEIADVSESFNRMRVSLEKAFRMLEG